MKILLLGSGAREHALVRALLLDDAVEEVLVAPGNPGILAEERVHRAGVDPLDGEAVAHLAVTEGVDLVVVGPEAPLVAGVADAVRAAGIPAFGPGADAARLEASKAYAKDVMATAGVPTAASHPCTSIEQVEAALDSFGPPYVVKDDGLAAGKGVVVTADLDAALAHARTCLSRPASPEGLAPVVVVEEYLDGPEISVLCVCDGLTVVPLEPAQDFKRLGEGDTGPNTGGMGAYSPVPWAPAGLVDDVVRDIAQPVVQVLAAQETPFVGILYCGLALTPEGVKVIEFNVRFGDPETQVVLPRLRSPLGRLLLAAAMGRLAQFGPLEWEPEAAVAVVVAAEGYPGAVVPGGRLEGLAQAAATPDVHVLHAGTAGGVGDAPLTAAGGRALSVVGRGPGVIDARARAYEAVERISLEGGFHRPDIAAGH